MLGGNIRLTMLADGLLVVEGQATIEQRTRLNQIVQALGAKIAVIDMVTTPDYQPRQIQVRVKAVEINKNAVGEIGVDWGGLNGSGAHDQPILFGTDLLGGGAFKLREGISAQLQALVTSNKARILAEPNLLVADGQTANILVGGEIPLPVVQTLGSVSVAWKQYGVKLVIKATIDPDGKNINLDVAPEVSSLDYSNSIVVSGISMPALVTRSVHSMLHVLDGQTLVIGGLYQVTHSNIQRRIPLLSDIPLIGNLFKHTSTKNQETELMVFVTPIIVTEASTAAQTKDGLRKMGETP